MKILLVIAALCIAGTVGIPTEEQIRATFAPCEAQCIANTGVDPAEVAEAKQGRFANPSRRLLCFGQCILQCNNITFADGRINLVGFTTHATSILLNTEQITRVTQACTVNLVTSAVGSLLPLGGGDACQRGGNMIICFYNTM